MIPECVATGDHHWRGSSVCSACGERLRCACGCYVREDNIRAHIERCPWVLSRLVDERNEIESRLA